MTEDIEKFLSEVASSLFDELSISDMIALAFTPGSALVSEFKDGKVHRKVVNINKDSE